MKHNPEDRESYQSSRGNKVKKVFLEKAHKRACDEKLHEVIEQVRAALLGPDGPNFCAARSALAIAHAQTLKQHMSTQDIMDFPLADMGFTERTLAKLERYGKAIVLKDLTGITPDQVLKWPNTGEITLSEIQEVLSRFVTGERSEPEWFRLAFESVMNGEMIEAEEELLCKENQLSE